MGDGARGEMADVWRSPDHHELGAAQSSFNRSLIFSSDDPGADVVAAPPFGIQPNRSIRLPQQSVLAPERGAGMGVDIAPVRRSNVNAYATHGSRFGVPGEDRLSR